MPRVSVVVPTRNRRRMLGQAIASVLAQRDACLEVVVVDDGSEDDTRSYVASLDDPRVRLLVNERSRGVAAARNLGCSHAGGSWIAFLDDDDLWSPDKLRLQLLALSESGRDWCYAGAVSVDAEFRILSGGPPPTAEASLTALPCRNPLPAGASNVLVRRKLLEEVGAFDPSLRHLADWDLWIRLGLRGSPAVVPLALVAYRIHERNASIGACGASDELRLIEERYGAARAGRRVDRAHVQRWIAWGRLRAGDRTGAIGAYLRASRAGDVASLGRAVLALLGPRVTDWRGHERAVDPWRREAEGWLSGLGTAIESRLG